MEQLIERLIEEYSHCYELADGVRAEDLEGIEGGLLVYLPQSYKWFLMNYGTILTKGKVIYGVDGNGYEEVREKTQKYKKYDLPMYYIVIEEAEDCIYCLDVENIGSGDCEVIQVFIEEAEVRTYTDSFYDYLFYRLFDESEVTEEEFVQEYKRIHQNLMLQHQ